MNTLQKKKIKTRHNQPYSHPHASEHPFIYPSLSPFPSAHFSFHPHLTSTSHNLSYGYHERPQVASNTKPPDDGT
ncbi:hypothetical protein SERLADRAFT_390348 [Serpula lacrymans var. lacrymans S7.9]|uniref:Uncharacterized protein n=1 Tax=Serpula lacrymans var. lacrymans (strain S7.9) TaxID=578457 RepID=F8NXM7_SERL9|nr:uncharacterized protein SERLADRAFT_390348 [Serpula lacrymans var. lacrymans S7.9]EGO24699.1 hypothetical protein SERLADRAFT_390348 [Serpula lacrymans var. lacrymans S7.9]